MPDTIKYTLDSDVYALRNISKGKNGASLVLKSGSVSGSYNLKIYANDTLGSYGTLDVVITIINTNNAPNVSSDTFMIEENIASGAFIVLCKVWIIMGIVWHSLSAVETKKNYLA